MKNILAFSASNNKNSINTQLVDFAVSHIAGQNVQSIRLTDYDLPIYSEDLQKERGFSVDLQLLMNKIKEADALIISVNEHNQMVSAFFKNILDWLSALDPMFLKDKKILLMSTSNDIHGASSAFEYTKEILPSFGGDILESFSIPSFSENYSQESNTITNELLLLGFVDVIQNFSHHIQ